MPNTGIDRHLFLICRIGPGIGALPLACVRETLRPLPVERLAQMPPFVLGLSVIRGLPTPVVDAGRLTGPSNSSSLSTPGRFVLIRLDTRAVALAVDAVLGVRILLPELLGEIPPLLRDSAAEYVTAIGTLDAGLLLVLEASRLIPESVWREAATADGA